MTIGRLQLAFWKGRPVSLVLQSESSECGLACIAMVASYHGYRVDLPTMRRRFSISLKGATMRSLMTVAQALQLQTRPLQLSLDRLSDLQLPCVVHWDMNHFVVLTKVARNHIVVLDPAVGERRLSMEESSKHFTGIALELAPGARFSKEEERQRFSLLSLMGNVSGLRRGLAQMLLLGLALQTTSLVAPFFVQWVVDEAVVSADRDLVTVLGLGFLLLALIQTAISAFRSWVTTVLSTNLNFQWFGNAFSHLLRLPIEYFEKRHLGDVVSRFGSIQTIQQAITTQFVEAIIDGILVISTFIIMVLYSVQLAMVAAGAVALYALTRLAMYRPIREATAEQIIHAAKQQTHFLESARGVQSIRLFNRTEERRVGWMNALAEQFNANLRIARLSVSYQAVSTGLFNIERVIVIWLAALAVLDNRFSVGMLFAFISYKDQFSQRVAPLIDKLFELGMLRVHGERVADIVLSEPETDTHDVELDLADVNPEIQVRNLTFRYSDSEPQVLKELNLTIAAGQCVAITGASGCGKTTLVKLLLGLLTPTGGDVLVGGVPLARFGLTNYRQIVGTVMQDEQLFAGSIADNISFFDPAPDQRRIEECGELAAIHREIVAMPMGYNTLVGDIGTGLSGGQKQRVLLARALYKQPRILILDEATSHLDVLNELQVNAAVKGIPLTRIIIAHRPETIAMADRVIAIDEGRVVRDFAQQSVGRGADVELVG